MDYNVAAFLRDWVSENVNFIGYPPEGDMDPDAKSLAIRCIADAEAAGITRAALEAEVGDLAAHLHGELRRLADEEVAKKP
jgi:hypothetical protein